jgi:hypothetical protein
MPCPRAHPRWSSSSTAGSGSAGFGRRPRLPNVRFVDPVRGSGFRGARGRRHPRGAAWGLGRSSVPRRRTRSRRRRPALAREEKHRGGQPRRRSGAGVSVLPTIRGVHRKAQPACRRPTSSCDSGRRFVEGIAGGGRRQHEALFEGPDGAAHDFDPERTASAAPMGKARRPKVARLAVPAAAEGPTAAQPHVPRDDRGARVRLRAVIASQTTRRRPTTSPQANIDHWHAAYGLYVCDAPGAAQARTTRESTRRRRPHPPVVGARWGRTRALVRRRGRASQPRYRTGRRHVQERRGLQRRAASEGRGSTTRTPTRDLVTEDFGDIHFATTAC